MDSITWRGQPEDVWIPCTEVRPGEVTFNSPRDIVVHFVLNGIEQVAFVPVDYVDREKKLLAGRVVGERDGCWLIDLPVRTLKAGFRHIAQPGERALLTPRLQHDT